MGISHPGALGWSPALPGEPALAPSLILGLFHARAFPGCSDLTPGSIDHPREQRQRGQEGTGGTQLLGHRGALILAVWTIPGPSLPLEKPLMPQGPSPFYMERIPSLWWVAGLHICLSRVCQVFGMLGGFLGCSGGADPTRGCWESRKGSACSGPPVQARGHIPSPPLPSFPRS